MCGAGFATVSRRFHARFHGVRHATYVRVLLLGPVEVRAADDEPITLTGTNVRALLARLAVAADRVVPTDVLMAAVWAGQPPARGANALQALVSRLRRVLGAETVVGHPAGYRLAIDPAGVDGLRFEDLVAAGRERSDLGMLREAEALWRGRALADLVALPFAAAAAERWDELRVSAAVDRLAMELAIGNDVLVELRPLAAAHPLAEPLQGLLIRALYATGQQAEALAAYVRVRRALADELGVDPSQELADLHVALLRQDRDLAPRRRRSNLRAQVTSFVGRDDGVGMA
jgi:DNA-binding SARP family transcriptional activator